MNRYENQFAKKTESELYDLYNQFLEFERKGIVSSETTFGKIRDIYCEMCETNHLVCMERDLLHAIADLWYLQHKNC